MRMRWKHEHWLEMIGRVTEEIRQAGGTVREEYGATIAFLLSDDAGYITGASLPVDGGYLST